ncbi:hypothetical protein NQ314_001248, partial [Rhamnusium bicolor]
VLELVSDITQDPSSQSASTSASSKVQQEHQLRDSRKEEVTTNTMTFYNPDPAKWILTERLIDYIAQNGTAQNLELDFKVHQKVFCGPCRLFSADATFAKEGVDDWKNLKKLLMINENSTNHKSNLLLIKVRGSKLGRIDKSLTEAIEEEMSYWQNVLRRVVVVDVNITELKEKGLTISKAFCHDIENDIIEELVHLQCPLKSLNLGSNRVAIPENPRTLLKWIKEKELQDIYPNVEILLRIFNTLPISNTSAERSFSVLKRIKNLYRTSMIQERVSGLALLCIEGEFTRRISFEETIKQTQMEFGLDKCRINALKRGTWVEETAYQVGEAEGEISTMDENELYKYLGYEQTYVLEEKVVKSRIKERMQERMRQILKSSLTIHTDRHIPNNRPDIVFTNRQTQQTYLIDITILLPENIEKKYREKISKYLPLAEEVKAMWRQEQVNIIPIVIGATGEIPVTLKPALVALKIKGNAYITMQKAVLIDTCSLTRADQIREEITEVEEELSQDSALDVQSVYNDDSVLAVHRPLLFEAEKLEGEPQLKDLLPLLQWLECDSSSTREYYENATNSVMSSQQYPRFSDDNQGSTYSL